MSKHTPGPWTASRDEMRKRYMDALYVHMEETQICEVTISVRGPTEEQTANAHLIAAAPDMLEALKNAQHAMRNTNVPTHQGMIPAFAYDHPMMASIRDAIAKAEGQS